LQHDLVPPATIHVVTGEPRLSSSVPIRFDRPALVCDVDVGGSRPLTVVNVHLRAPIASAVPGQKVAPFTWKHVGAWAEGYYLSSIKRTGQALELRLLADSLFDKDPHALMVFAGDFNAEANETPLRLLAGATEDTGNAALAPRALVLLDRALDASRRYTVVHYGRPQMFDHLLASHALYGRFRHLEVHNEALGDEAVAWAKNIGAAGSYHAAVVAEFSPEAE
jgi:predicted extracellular nuclease